MMNSLLILTIVAVCVHAQTTPPNATVATGYCASIGPALPSPSISSACQMVALSTLLQIAACGQTSCTCLGGNFDLATMKCPNAPPMTCLKMSCLSKMVVCFKTVVDRWVPQPECKADYPLLMAALSPNQCPNLMCSFPGCPDETYITACGPVGAPTTAVTGTPAGPPKLPVCSTAKVVEDPAKFLGACGATKEFAAAMVEMSMCEDDACKCINGVYSLGKCSVTHTCAQLSCRASRSSCMAKTLKKLSATAACTDFVAKVSSTMMDTCIADACKAPGCPDKDYVSTCAAVSGAMSNRGLVVSAMVAAMCFLML